MELKLFDLPTKEVYKDLFQPGMQKVGQALSTVLDTATLILLPLKLLNEKARINYDINLKIYSEKLNQSSNTLTQVQPFVGLPIIEKLTQIGQNELSESFINLLTKASFEETANLVHPVFITILNNLSADEAKILFHYHKKQRIPYLSFYIHRYKEEIQKLEESNVKSSQDLQHLINYTFQDREAIHIPFKERLTGIENEVELIFPKNISLYLDNLHHNGLIEFENKLINKNDLDKYDSLLNSDYSAIHNDLKKLLQEAENTSVENLKFEEQIRKESIKFTNLGISFIEACIVD
ncbi:Abi-alpha family protein [Flavobacterium algicola]|uniref:Abi-alpha family protein n=1 Tax=Flavobacterium algicola TaxID=556529 RepID=UPI001EFD23FB|nr:Abi-alpha family protein [Flavobacterium algicola]MCG9791218.1 DUF4393 domain-containing protein [Flavobacterium algicola]